MRRIAIIAAFLCAGLTPVEAFPPEVQSTLDGLKRGKPLPISAVQTLMRGAERWCYRETDGACSWSDIYLDVTEKGAIYEIGNAWDERYDIVFTDEGEFRDGRFICEIAHDWLPSLRAFHRADGTPVGGRELYALRQEVQAAVDLTQHDCFDYVLEAVDAAGQTVQLTQRQYPAGGEEADPAQDTLVTLHFDPASAAALTWSY